MKYILVMTVVTSLIAGFFIGKSQAPSPEIRIEEVERKVEVIKEVPPQIKDTQGDEALAQAFTLFLAALGLDKIKVDKDEVREIMQDPSAFIARNSIKEKLSKRVDVNPDIENESSWGMPRNTSGMTTSKNVAIYEKVSNTPIPSLKEPIVFLAKSQKIDSLKVISQFIGNFSGHIKFFAGKSKGQSHRVTISVDYVQEGKEIDGQSEVILYDEEGNNYSTSRATGGNNRFFVADDGTIIVKIVDNTFLHFTDKFGVKLANYYEEGNLVGTAKLFRN